MITGEVSANTLSPPDSCPFLRRLPLTDYITRASLGTAVCTTVWNIPSFSPFKLLAFESLITVTCSNQCWDTISILQANPSSCHLKIHSQDPINPRVQPRPGPSRNLNTSCSPRIKRKTNSYLMRITTRNTWSHSACTQESTIHWNKTWEVNTLSPSCSLPRAANRKPHWVQQGPSLSTWRWEDPSNQTQNTVKSLHDYCKHWF